MTDILQTLKDDDELLDLLYRLSTPKDLVTSALDIEVLLGIKFAQKQSDTVGLILDRIRSIIEDLLLEQEIDNQKLLEEYNMRKGEKYTKITGWIIAD